MGFPRYFSVKINIDIRSLGKQLLVTVIIGVPLLHTVHYGVT